MKAKKKWQIRNFELYEISAMEEYLREQAADGWVLQKIAGGSFFVFERTEPLDLVFSVAVIGDMPVLAAEDCDQAMTFREYCERAGWRFVCSNRSIQIFCSPAEKELIPIETDKKLRVEGVLRQLRKSMWGNWLSAWFSAYVFWRPPIHYREFLENNISLNLRTLGLLGAIYGLAVGLRAHRWYKQAKKGLKEGENVCFLGLEEQKKQEASLPWNVLNFLFLLTALLLLIQFLFGGTVGIYGFAFALGIGVFQVFLYRGIRKKGFRRWTYALAYLTGCCLILFFVGLLSVMIRPIEDREQRQKDVHTQWLFTSEELGLGSGDEPPYTKQGSSILGRMQEYESAGTDLSEGEPRLWRVEYKYYHTDSTWLLGRLREELLKPPKARYKDNFRSFRTETVRAPEEETVLRIYDRVIDKEGQLLEETPAGYLLETGDSLLYFRFTGEGMFSEEALLSLMAEKQKNF